MDAKNDLLLEIGCEEIPSSFILPALERMKSLFTDFCGAERISFESVETYATPRRLVILARGVSERQADVVVEVKGPPAKAALDPGGKWTQVAEKFAASRGSSVKNLVVKNTDKGDYVFIIKNEKGVQASKVIPGLPARIVNALSFPKSMKWDVRQIRFARPVRWILLLYGDKTFKGGFDGIPCGRHTYGNRYFGSDRIKIDTIPDYFEKLEKAGVMVDHRKRTAFIKEKALETAGGRPHITGSLLEEVSFLVEYPYMSIGKFPEEFTKLPPEVLIICIEKNQKYFPVFDSVTGKVLPRFVNVLNVPLADSEVVGHGFEKVLISRLKDARFFFDEDVKKPLPGRVDMLSRITFQKKLGSLMDKTKRVISLLDKNAAMFGLNESDLESAKRAALLMKADLTTQMVFEYSEIQGTVGKYYALEAGETEAVAQAIEEHYMPRYAEDEIPKSAVGAALAVADKMDTLAGYFSIGLIPSGSADPFQLRRQALGVIRILDGFNLNISLPDLINRAMDSYDENIVSPEKRDSILGDLLEFLRIRFAGFMESLGYEYDVVNAIDLRRAKGISDARALADALAAERAKPEFKPMHEVFTRVSNIQSKSAKTEDFQSVKIDAGLFETAVEAALYETYTGVRDKWATGQVGYQEKISSLYSLTEPAKIFFDNVLVMAEDERVRKNRLALLKRIRDLYLEAANFKEIVIKGE